MILERKLISETNCKSGTFLYITVKAVFSKVQENCVNIRHAPKVIIEKVTIPALHYIFSIAILLGGLHSVLEKVAKVYKHI